MSDENSTERTVEAFDYELGQLLGLPGVTHTKQTTVLATNGLTESSTWIVQTFRKRDIAEEPEQRQPARETVFLQFIGRGGRSLRLVIPPQVAEVIARQHDQLVTKNRISGARQAAATRKERGIEPAFLKRSALKGLRLKKSGEAKTLDEKGNPATLTEWSISKPRRRRRRSKKGGAK